MPIGKPVVPGIGYDAEGCVVGAATVSVTVTVTCVVVVTVIGAGQLVPD